MLGCWLGSAAIAAALPMHYLGRTAAAGEFLALTLALVPLSLAAVVNRRAPDHPAGAVLAAAGLCWVIAFIPSDVEAGVFGGTWMLLYLPWAVLLLLPDGRFDSRRWSLVAATLTAVCLAFILLVAGESALGAAGWVTATGAVLLLTFFALLLLSAAAPLLRYRSSPEAVRLQLRWVLLAGMTVPVTLLVCWASYLVLGGPDLVAAGLVLMYLAIPAAATVAIVRPTLIDVDRAVIASLAASIVGAAVLGALTVTAAAAGVAVTNWSPWAGMTTTVLLTIGGAVAFRWMSTWLQHALYPERGRALRAVQGLVAAVDAGTARPQQVELALASTLRDPGLRIGYRSLLDGTPLTLDGAPFRPGPGPLAPVRVHGQQIGTISCSAARVKPPPAAVVQAAAPLIDAARMRAEVARASAELQASRQRILTAADAERRRIERDLHDGVQQRLVALGMRLRMLQDSPAAGAPVTTALEAAIAEIATAVVELRHLAHGLRPQVLDEGLGPALVHLCQRTPGAIELDLRAPHVPEPVATTAYYVVSECLTNALRHAGASRIRISVHAGAALLQVRIDDDGRGGAVLRPAGGLIGLTDRVATLGGHLTVGPGPAGGTSVRAVLPCAS